MRRCGLALALLSLSGVFLTAHSLAVMSVDLGSEWMKIAVVSPGMPMEICLNRDSQRKTPVVIAFRDGERQYGDMALNTQTKFPDKAFANFLYLLGKPLDHPIVQEFQKKFPYYKLSSDENSGGVKFTHPEGMEFSVEELVGMILKNAQAAAQATAGQRIKDAVITVPAFFNQAERRALARAASIAGINLLQLMNDNTAVALNYGAFRRKEFNATATNILFYDMGTGSTTATVISYQTAKTRDRGFVETAPVLSVKGVGYDRDLGGLEFKHRLGEHLAKKFDELKKASKKVHQNNRALFKLYKEAERVKKILSANTEINAQVENVMEDIDLKVTVTRQEFEDMCADLFARVTQPIEDALASSEIGLDQINQVIVVGGNTRIPKIQQILQEYLKGKGLSKSINADEAAAMGAAYQAAYLSKGFKVLPFVAKDANLYPIQVEFSRDGIKNIQRVIFNRNNEFPKHKTILATRMEKDFTVYVNYGDLSFLSKKEQSLMGKSSNISSILVKGVAESLKKYPTEEAEVRGVRIHMAMDASGIFHIDQVETLFEKEQVEEAEASTLDKIKAQFGKMFGGGEGEAELPVGDKKEPEQGDKPSEGTGSETQSETVKNETAGEAEPDAPGTEEKPKEEKSKDDKPKEEKPKEAAAEAREKKNVTKKVELKQKLDKEVNVLDMPDVDQELIEASAKKLQDLDDKDSAQLALDKARNALESFLHETKDKLSTEEYQNASTEKERTKIVEALNKEQEWLEYESDAADTETLKGKLASIAVITKDVIDRVNEHRDRPQALDSLNNLLKISKEYLTNLESVPEDESVFTKVELQTLGTLITDTETWVVEQTAIQMKTPLNEAPKLTMKMIFEKIQGLDRETKYLMNKARYAQPKKKVKKEKEPEKSGDDETIKVNEEAIIEEEKPLEETQPTPAQEDTASAVPPDPKTEVPVVEPQDPKQEEVHSEL
ncbi:hypoxia up-regulated protein 1 [Galendromus occidentalis]|uniref:Hypoxia up-regulated protein 1 n=1 Tax=Galendromus occidentalis TaxID=34638 RepID=A0AAJ6VY67_9ACAR|nr:hypoxia up-regulated protein 1 [Galendromus occidentalis]